MALNNVPLAGQTLGVTRNPINQNFNVIDTAFSINHVDYNAPDQGKHKFLSMPVQGAAPATTATELGIFTQTSALTGVPEWAFRRANNGAVIEFTSSTQANNGWTRLPSGILLKWGQIGGNAAILNQQFVINLNGIGPAFTAVYNAQANYFSVSIAKFVVVNITNLTPAALTLNKTASAVSGGAGEVAYFLVIGV